MRLLKELKKKGFSIETETAKVYCKLFKESFAEIDIANFYKFRPQTKYLNVKLHQFWSYAVRETPIKNIDTKSQPADFLTKPLDEDLLVIHQRYVMG